MESNLQSQRIGQSSTLLLREARREDWPALAEIHLAVLPEALTTRLGREYAFSVFYPIATAHPHTLTILAQEESCVKGFVMFAKTPHTFKHLLAQRRLPLLYAMMRHPGAFFFLLRSLFETLTPPRICWLEEPPTNTIHFFLMGVEPKSRNRGIAKAMLEEGLATAKSRFGANSCLVQTHTELAARFHLLNGFRVIGTEKRDGKVFTVLLRDL